MKDVIKQITGLQVRTAPEDRTDWLPSDAVYPVPWRGDVLTVDLAIERDGDGFRFRYASRDGSLSEATHHATLAEAESAAQQIFGDPLDWQSP